MSAYPRRVLLAVKELYKKEGGAVPEPVLNMSWSYTNPVNPDLGEALKEINGRALEDLKVFRQGLVLQHDAVENFARGGAWRRE